MQKQFYLLGIVAIVVLSLIFVIAGCDEQQKSPVESSTVDNTAAGRLANMSSGCEPFVTELWAGAAQNDLSKGTLVGTVTVWNENGYLYVKYQITEAEWYLTETHVWVGTDYNNIPQNAAPGQFPYKKEFDDPQTEYTFEIPADGWDCETNLYLAAHATVCKPGEGEPSTQFVQGVIATQTLWAGQHIDAGTITVAIEGENLVVTYETKDGWEMTATHLAVSKTLEGIPQTKKGNPIPGKFPYKHEDLGGVTGDSYTILLSDFDIECDDMLYIAAHADLQKMIEGGSYQTETGWADGDDFPGKNWATYFTVTIECETVYPEPECETAWALGNYTFIDFGISDKWGWFFDYTICCEQPSIILYSTGTGHTGNLGGRTGADALCEGNKPAGYANWRAFLSVNADDEIRNMPGNYGIPTGIPIKGPNGAQIASNWADLLDGTIAVTLIDAGVASVNGLSGEWWSGSYWNGSLALGTQGQPGTCNSWTYAGSSLPYGQVGGIGEINFYWMERYLQYCNRDNVHVLCVAW